MIGEVCTKVIIAGLPVIQCKPVIQYNFAFGKMIVEQYGILGVIAFSIGVFISVDLTFLLIRKILKKIQVKKE